MAFLPLVGLNVSGSPGEIEKFFRSSRITRLVGVDEAGRGALFGPVVAAAVALSPETPPEGLNDSKKLTPAKRVELAPRIRQWAVSWGIGEAPAQQIDDCGILEANFAAMRQAVELCLLRVPLWKVEMVVVDGPLCITEFRLPQKPVVKGDQRSICIAAASVLAKVHRDNLMVVADEEFPGYGLAGHKGYGTASHMEAIQRLGLTPHHRRTFCSTLASQ